MTDYDRLPPELQQLERQLAARPRPEPSAELRRRIVGGVQAELLRNGNGSRNRWTFALTTALGIMLWINLSLSATRATDYGLQLGSEPPSVVALANQLHRLAPELSEHEAIRQAVLFSAGSKLAFCPDLRDHAALRQQASQLGNLLP